MTEPKTSIRIAMWSGPRNISTALMRSWGNRPDTVVCDEPLYAHYLKVTGIDHPGREEVMDSQNTDWKTVVETLTGEIPDGKPIYYQKHMAHHLLENMDRDWIDSLDNAFLIRDPREMLTSLLRVTPNATVADTGLPQQWELFERLRKNCGSIPIVIDAKDVLTKPRELLSLLCDEAGVPFDEAMLSWPAGPRETDGVWAKHWYAAVEKSTGFLPYVPKPDPVPATHESVHEECREYYDRLYAHRLKTG